MIQYLKLSILILYSTVIGAVVGFLTWFFLSVLNFTTKFLWITLPNLFYIQNWTLLLCLVGGVVVGICQKKFGNYPRKMDEVLAEFNKTKRVDYKSLPKATVAALSSLSFGASLGPEAALVGIVGGLSTWAGDILKSLVNKKQVIKEYGNILTEYSIETTIGMIFRAPLFGLTTFFEDKKDSKFIKIIKIIVYLITTIAGFGVFILLSKIDNRELSIVNFGKATVGKNEIIAIIPLIFIGVLFSMLYEFFGYIIHKAVKPLENYKVIKAVIGGLALGLLGTLLPNILFSGEHQLTKLAMEWKEMSIYLLFITGMAKLFITEFCLSTGWRGGHIFPVIFAGASIGYGIAMLFSIDPVTSVALVTTSITSSILKKPIAVVLILIFFFPIKLIILMILAAYIPLYIFKLRNKGFNR
ncbi:chloride channel protein [Clostridium frigidicarnis]|uniref:H+/Cl-antiporter ClcA n=1 Tax=Clostridium frigidicarnis TaxID=84698 RepID=A0A1I0XBX1_9CLOT|nr:chloride channel protein [Clostridium frigidicarnis]SFA98542.1 H+/Cl-antiporter ClcA [Clostridium frigidicarnis]